MASAAIDRMFAGALATLALAAPTSVNAESGIELLTTFRSLYQERIQSLGIDRGPQLFVGTASVAPRYGSPWMVSLQIRGAPGALAHFCGGVAVAPSWVLTAAHCVTVAIPAGDEYTITPLKPERLQILTHSNVLFGGGQTRFINKIVIYPEFRISPQRVPQKGLALLKIAGEPNLTPLPLVPESKADELLSDGAKVRIFGWGTASFDPNGPVSNNLLYAFVDVVGLSKCNAPEVYDGAVIDTMFCAGLGFADACQGDSGGPAIGYVAGKNYLVGITSWGVGCTTKKYPGVYENVAKFADWIEETIAARN